MNKINVEGIDRELLANFFLSRYWGESSVIERMAAAPGGVNPFDAAIPQKIQAQILEVIENLREQNISDKSSLLTAFWQHCKS